nr:uncharacterized protein LOC109154451 [Ipomoea batatas]
MKAERIDGLVTSVIPLRSADDRDLPFLASSPLANEIRSKQIVVVKRSRKRSQSDVGEAGPSNAPASSVLAVRQVRKTWKKRKDYPSLRSRSSTSQFFEALQGLNAAQTAAIIEMGFVSLFHLQIDNLPTKMGYWLVQNYNPRNSMLYLADGFPRGDLKIEKWSRAHNTDLLEEWKGLVVKSARGYLYSDVIKAMLSCENGDVDQIKHLNWCDYVLRSLMDSQLSWAKSSKALFTGPPLFFTVFYVDRVVVFTRDIPRQIPSFVGWTAQLIKDREVAEIQAGGFGLGRVEDRFIPAVENIQEQAEECHRSVPEPATISANTSCWYNKRDSKSGLFEVSNSTASDARIEAMGHEIRRLQARIEKMGKQPHEGNPCMSLALYCDICGGPHGTQECTSTYDDPGCEQEVSVVRQEVSNYRQESTSSIRNLETQLAQVSKAMAERPRGALPSTIENNPRERVQAITLRSGKELPDPELHKGCTSKSPIEEENVKVHVEESAEQNINPVAPAIPHAEEALEKGKEKIDVPVYRPPLPYPGIFNRREEHRLLDVPHAIAEWILTAVFGGLLPLVPFGAFGRPLGLAAGRAAGDWGANPSPFRHEGGTLDGPGHLRHPSPFGRDPDLPYPGHLLSQVLYRVERFEKRAAIFATWKWLGTDGNRQHPLIPDGHEDSHCPSLGPCRLTTAGFAPLCFQIEPQAARQHRSPRRSSCNDATSGSSDGRVRRTSPPLYPFWSFTAGGVGLLRGTRRGRVALIPSPCAHRKAQRIDGLGSPPSIPSVGRRRDSSIPGLIPLASLYRSRAWREQPWTWNGALTAACSMSYSSDERAISLSTMVTERFRSTNSAVVRT